MASTNHTQYYNLPQYIGTDKPTYLVDFNQAMASIDAGIHSAKAKADNNENNITTLTGTVSGLSTTVGQHTTSIGNLDTAVGGLTSSVGSITNLNTTDRTSVVNAINEVNIKASNFLNFSNINTYEPNTFIYSNCSARQGAQGITVVLDSSKSYGKIYCVEFTSVDKTSTGDFSITTPDTGLRPTEAFTIGGAGIAVVHDSAGLAYNIQPVTLTINTNGTITVSSRVFVVSGKTPNFLRIYLHNSVIVFKDFSDSPVNPN